MPLISLVNGDAVTQSPGQILRLNGSSALLALADVPTNASNTFGSRFEVTLSGASGYIVGLWDGLLVPLDAEPNIGDTIYISATTPGNGTPVAPLYTYPIGLCSRKENISGVWHANIVKTISPSGTTPGYPLGGLFVHTTPNLNSGSPTGFTENAGSFATLTASTEVIDVNFNLSPTKNWQTGNITVQRDFLVRNRTYSFVAASTVDQAGTLVVTGPPTAGANATITSPYAFWIQSGASLFQGRVLLQQGADIPSANNITCGEGNQFNITGTTQVRRIDITRWSIGSVIILRFTGTNTVASGTAASANFYGIQLVNGATLNVTSGQTLTLYFDGSFWREIARGSNPAYPFGGLFVHTSSNGTSGSPTSFTETAGAHSNMAAGTEDIDVYFDLSASKTWQTGGITLQRDFVIANRRYQFDGASVVTLGATLSITGGPAAGTNATITNKCALRIEASDILLNFGSRVAWSVSNANPAGSTSIQKAVTGNAPLIFTNSLGAAVTVKYFDFVGDSSASLLSIYKSGQVVVSPVASTFAASTEAIGLNVNTAITKTWAAGALTTQRESLFQAPTYAFSSASTITAAATVAITGAPIAGANATITNSSSLWVQAGSSRFEGRVLISQGVDVASGSNITLTEGNQFNITGNTQIDRISSVGWKVGSFAILQFNSNPTVTNNTAVSGSFYGLKLAGSVNFTPTAGSTLTLYFDGSWWREIARTVL